MAIEDNTIDLFMWGYQRHFQISAQHAAEKLFQKLDPDLEAKIFLLGLLRNDSTERHPVCLEPEDCGWQPTDFSFVRKNAEHFLAIDGEANLMSTTDQGMRSIQARRHRRAIAEAVYAALNAYRNAPESMTYYFSGFIEVDEYDVGIILVLSHRENHRHYRLPLTYAEDRYAVPSSLEEAAADIFVRRCLRELHVPNPELVDCVRDCDPEELLRKATSRMMEAPVFAANSIEGLYGLHNACNYIASLNYEGASSLGEMIIAKENHQNVKHSLRLQKPVPLRQHRAIRKLLEISTSGEALLSDGSHVTGFGKSVGLYDQAMADMFRVRFTGHHKWELLHAEHKVMEVKYGVPMLPIPALNKAQFISTFEIIFPVSDHKKVNLFYELSLEACRQRHGTLLIMTPEAENETARLIGQATAIHPITMTADLLKSVTAIDGAVIMDLEGRCHCIGAILDGIAISNGDSGRGARFNSALRYVQSLADRDIPCLAVVVSEDGTSELVPVLPRRIRRSELEKKELLVDEMLRAEKWSLDKSFPLVNWLDKNRFYLSEALCKKANDLIARHDAVLRECRAITVPRAKFLPHPRMSDAYLL